MDWGQYLNYSPTPPLTLNCYQSTAAGLGRSKRIVIQILKFNPNYMPYKKSQGIPMAEFVWRVFKDTESNQSLPHTAQSEIVKCFRSVQFKLKRLVHFSFQIWVQAFKKPYLIQEKSHIHLTATLKGGSGYLVKPWTAKSRSNKELRAPFGNNRVLVKTNVNFLRLIKRTDATEIIFIPCRPDLIRQSEFRKSQRSCKTSHLVAILETSCLLNNGFTQLFLKWTRPHKKY